jgi:hypothetical protein
LRNLARPALVLLSVACQEQLGGPVDCPNLCPGGYQIVEDTLFALPGADSAYVGYRNPGQGVSLLVSHQFPVSEVRAAYKFARRTDSLSYRDTLRAYTFDSLALELTVSYRDTTVHGLKVFLYRLPSTTDSTADFAAIDGAFTPATTIDSVLVDDTLRTKRLRLLFTGADTAKLSIPPGDSGVLGLGVQIRADQGTGIRIGGAAAGSNGPSFINYVTLIQSADTTTQHRIVTPGIQFNTFVAQSAPAVDSTLLTVGGAPSARSLIRFPWSARLRDSATLVRATLQLLPTTPTIGLNGDTAFVQVQPILADFGGKSPAVTDASFTAETVILPGMSDTVSFEVRRALTSWQGEHPVPTALMLQLLPEVSSYSRAVFGSSRTTGFVPRIIVTYALKFPFGEP